MKKSAAVVLSLTLTQTTCGTEARTREVADGARSSRSPLEVAARPQPDADDELRHNIRQRYAALSDDARRELAAYFDSAPEDVAAAVAYDPLAMPTITLLVAGAAGAVGVITATLADRQNRQDRQALERQMQQQMEGGISWHERGPDPMIDSTVWDLE